MSTIEPPRQLIDRYPQLKRELTQETVKAGAVPTPEAPSSTVQKGIDAVLQSIAYSKEASKNKKSNEEQNSDLAKFANSTLKFELTGGQIVTKLTNADGEVIRQIPPEVSVKLAKALNEALEKKIENDREVEADTKYNDKNEPRLGENVDEWA